MTVSIKGMTVLVKGDSPQAVTQALYELKKKMKKDNVMEDYRRKDFFMSASQYKKFKKNEAKRKIMREIRKQQWYDNTHKVSS